MKIQLAFRDTGHIQNDYRSIIAIGIIEYPDGPEASEEIPEGMIGSYVMSMVTEEGKLRPGYFTDRNEFRYPSDAWGHKPSQETSVSRMVTASVWRTPWFAGHCEMFLRKSHVAPSREGFSVMIAAGLVAVGKDAAVDEESVFQLGLNDQHFFYEGRVGETLKPEWGAPRLRETMRGEGLTAFFRTPIWGFGDEAVAMPWDMSLSLAAEFDRYQTLALLDARDEWDEAEFGALSSKMTSLGLNNVERDADFMRFMKTMAASDLLAESCARPETREHRAFRNDRIREVLSGILQVAEEPAPRL